MEQQDTIHLIKQLFDAKIKGQLCIDFSGDGESAKVRFTNISVQDLEKLKLEKED